MFFTLFGIQFTTFHLIGVGLALVVLLLFLSKKKSADKKSGASKDSNLAGKFGKRFKEILVKKFTTACDFGGQNHPVTLYIGSPKPDSHPLQFQSTWLSKSRGGNVPASIMDSFSKISKIAEEKHVPFPELCQYVVDELNNSKALVKDAKQASEFKDKKEAEKVSKSDQKAKPITDMRVVNIPKSIIDKFLLINILKRKLKKLAIKFPKKTILLPVIMGCLTIDNI